jgi:hypothetical protein
MSLLYSSANTGSVTENQAIQLPCVPYVAKRIRNKPALVAVSNSWFCTSDSSLLGGLFLENIFCILNVVFDGG